MKQVERELLYCACFIVAVIVIVVGLVTPHECDVRTATASHRLVAAELVDEWNIQLLADGECYAWRIIGPPDRYRYEAKKGPCDELLGRKVMFPAAAQDHPSPPRRRLVANGLHVHSDCDNYIIDALPPVGMKHVKTDEPNGWCRIDTVPVQP